MEKGNAGRRRNKDTFHRPYVDKHVTTACDACRRKRSKCDGQTPCLPCEVKGILCAYSHNDSRRQRQQKLLDLQPISSQQDTTAPECTKPATGLNGKIDTSSSASSSDSRTSQDRTVGEDTESHECTTASNHTNDMRTAMLFTGNYNASNLHLQPQTYTIKDMQGKFAVRPVEDRRPQHHKILPKGATTIDCTHRPSRLVRSRRPSQSVRCLGRQGYAVPGYTRTFGNLSFSSSIGANGFPAEVQARQALNFSAPEHLVPPLIGEDESPLARAFMDFQQLGLRLIAQGTPPSQVAEQGLIDVTLFFRERMPGDPVNASAWTSEMLRSFRGTFSDELLLACAVCVASLMRWLLVPTTESYANMPDMMRPTRLQRSRPHPAWVDLMMFPSFRDALVNDLRDWTQPCIEAEWQLLWPNRVEEALVHNSRTQQTFLTPTFAKFAVDPKNWLMQKSILEVFPDIRGSEINISYDQSLP